ncbi:MAG: chitosanase [Pyrinomonadaceae bacterium]|nr:chitosanase [Pyrinomonadaceae bacterium]
MTFTQTDKAKAFAIVKTFETSDPAGDYAACVVLNDGAGVSYGISQFTHRSGSLYAVAAGYIASGGKVGADVIRDRLPTLRDISGRAIRQIVADKRFRAALQAAAATAEMRSAQLAETERLYFKPALTACRRLGFVEPLSLAVIFDSVVHGSFYRVARGVAADISNERAWITAYVRRRDAWLQSYPRLASTRYRMRFFLGQIAISNWGLVLPLNVHGVTVTAEMLRSVSIGEASAAAPQPSGKVIPVAVGEFAKSYDRIESAVSNAVTRADAAKSLWTTVAGTVWQTFWAVAAFLAGLPREVWIISAVIAGMLMLAYLYRQIELGRIRERTVAGGTQS